MNPNATLGTSLGLIISTTFLLGGAYMLTRRIWLIMGIHWSWNFFQAGVFGMPNSGTTSRGWIKPEINGQTWITGGAWGIEASVIAIGLMFLAGLFIFLMAIRNGQLVKPIWVRRKMEAISKPADLNA
jgi:CAAX protease family protein